MKTLAQGYLALKSLETPFVLDHCMHTYSRKNIDKLREENRGEHFPVGKIALNRRNNIRAVVQTTGTLG